MWSPPYRSIEAPGAHRGPGSHREIRAVLTAVLALCAALCSVPARSAEGPTNEIATGRSRPAYQELWLTLGVRFDDNRTILRDLAPQSDGLLVDTRIDFYDERSLELARLRTLGYFQADTNASEIDESYQYLSGATGPIFDIAWNQRLHAALGGDVSWYGGSFFSGLAALYLSFETIDSGWLSAYELSLGVERVGGDFTDAGDAAWAMLWSTFSTRGSQEGRDGLEVTPGVTIYYADNEQLRYAQAEMTLQYGADFLEWFTGIVWTTGWRRWYAGSVDGVDGDRRDWFLEAGASITIAGVFHPNLSFETIFEYERTWSNDPVQDGRGSSIGFLFHWGF